MQQVSRIQLSRDSMQVVKLPKSATILSIQQDDDDIWFYALTPHQQEECAARIIEIYKTGELIRDIDMERNYVGTFNNLYHVFETKV